MKKLICVLILICLVFPSAFAESTIYKSDKFFLYLDGKWEKFEENGASIYRQWKKNIVIREEPIENASKAYITFWGKLSYEGFAYDALQNVDYLSYDLIEKDGKFIPIIILDKTAKNNTFSAISFILGDYRVMFVGYTDLSNRDYRVLKEAILDIMLNASAR